MKIILENLEPTKEILDSTDWNRSDIPLILPSHFVKTYKADLEPWQIAALLDRKIVLVKGFWCMLSSYLYATSGEKTNKPLPYYLQFKKRRHAKVR